MSRTKNRELWRGAFGLVLGQSTFYYGPQYRDQGSGFLTVPNASSGALQASTRGIVPRQPDASPDSLRARGVATVYLAQPPDSSQTAEASEMLGFLRQVDPSAPVAGAATRSVVGARVPLRTLVSFHYARGEIVRQESDSAGQRLPTRWLRFAATYADAALERIDSTRSFGLSSRVTRR